MGAVLSGFPRLRRRHGRHHRQVLKLSQQCNRADTWSSYGLGMVASSDRRAALREGPMHRTNHESAIQNSTPFPWEVARAAPEDQAVGLELQLIELVTRRRSIRDDADPEAVLIDAEIEVVLDDFADLDPVMPVAV